MSRFKQRYSLPMMSNIPKSFCEAESFLEIVPDAPSTTSAAAWYSFLIWPSRFSCSCSSFSWYCPSCSCCYCCSCYCSCCSCSSSHYSAVSFASDISDNSKALSSVLSWASKQVQLLIEFLKVQGNQTISNCKSQNCLKYFKCDDLSFEMKPEMRRS